MKTPNRFSFFLSVYLGIVFAMLAHTAWAEGNNTQDLAKAAQNPVADMISLPLQNNTNFGVGPDDDVQKHIEYPAGNSFKADKSATPFCFCSNSIRAF